MVTAISTGADAAGAADGAAAGADARPPAPLPLSAAGSSGRLCIESCLRHGDQREDWGKAAGGVRVRSRAKGGGRRERGPR